MKQENKKIKMVIKKRNEITKNEGNVKSKVKIQSFHEHTCYCTVRIFKQFP